MTPAGCGRLLVVFALALLVLASCSIDGKDLPPAGMDRLPPQSDCATVPTEETDFDLTIESAIYRTAERVRVHLTPCVNALSQRVPALYLLHGAGADETQWPDVDILVAIDNAVSEGSFPPAVVIIPDAASAYGCIECTTELAEHLLGEVEPAVSAFAPIDADRRAIGGISRGGGLALRLAGLSPAQFVAVGAHSSISVPEDVLSAIAVNRLPVYLDAGSGDGLAPAAERMADVLASLGTAVEVTISDGDHDRVYWRSQATAYTDFYGRILAQ